MGTEQTPPPDRLLERLTGLADGIFAFAMTLLVVNLGYLGGNAAGSSPNIAAMIVSRIADFRSYIISFILLANFWVIHNNYFEHIRKSDAKMVWINLLLLMAISVLPYSTSIIGDYPLDAGAQLFFGFNVLIISALFFWNWTYVVGHHLVEPDLNPGHIKMTMEMSLGIVLIIIFAMVGGLINSHIGPFIYLLIPVSYFYFSREKKKIIQQSLPDKKE